MTWWWCGGIFYCLSGRNLGHTVKSVGERNGNGATTEIMESAGKDLVRL